MCVVGGRGVWGWVEVGGEMVGGGGLEVGVRAYIRLNQNKCHV